VCSCGEHTFRYRCHRNLFSVDVAEISFIAILLHLAISMHYLLDISKLLGIMGGCIDKQPLRPT
jgi:hypothetical protein